MRNKLLITISVLCLSTSVFADTAGKVNRWFDDMNYATVTAPGVYEGQSARYATLGGISTRAPITQPFHFVNVQTPKFSAGCGGIDFYTGGFSAIDADQFLDNLRTIGQNAQSLAWMLGLQIISPQLSGVLEDIQTWADTYANKSIDSCEAATAAIGGALDMFGAKEGNCTIKRMEEFGEDWTVANYACTTGGKIKSTESYGGDANKVDFIKGNIAWYVLMQDPFFKADTEFSEVVMNIIGTVIVDSSSPSDDSRTNKLELSPAINNSYDKERFKNIYKALLMGKESKDDLLLYRCVGAPSDSPTGCMKITPSLTAIKPTWVGLYQRIEDLIKSIVAKIYTDTPLTAEERGLIGSTRIPLYRYLAATAAYFPKGSDVSRLTSDYTRLIAEDILLRALLTVIEKVDQRTAMLKDGMGDAERIKDFRKQLDGVISGLASLRKENDFDVEQYFVMQERIQLYEKALMSRLGSGMVTSAMWGQ